MGGHSAALQVRRLALEVATPRGWARVVDGVDFDVGEAQAAGLVGESGCGKTLTALATLRVLPRAARVAGGRVLWRGADLLSLEESRLRQVRGGEIGIVFQEPGAALNPILTVGSQLAEAVRAHTRVSRREARARAVELLRRVGLPDPERGARSCAHELSGGMKQRAAIALALAGRPSLLIADEPTTALDVTVQAQVLDLLEALRREEGLALWLVTHDLAVVAERTEQVAVMYAGRVVERGPTARVFASPAHPYTRGLLAALPERAARGEPLAAIPGTVPDPLDLPSGCRFRTRCPLAAGVCAEVDPPLRPCGPGHEVACHYAEGKP